MQSREASAQISVIIQSVQSKTKESVRLMNDVAESLQQLVAKFNI